jgi:hypothetical protein
MNIVFMRMDQRRPIFTVENDRYDYVGFIFCEETN